jgi:RimJ/RimL family protein N-acetyltransferase
VTPLRDATVVGVSDVLSGDRIRLRALQESDLPILAGWWQDTAVAAAQNSGPVHPRPEGPIADMFRTWCANTGADVGLSVVDQESGELVGHTALFGATAVSRCATFAVLIGPPHQDRGYGTDTVRTMLRYGFAELGLHRVQLNVNGDNARGIATYEKCGFVVEGRMREFLFRDGRWHDLVQMGILDREWWAGRPPR